MHTVTEFRVLSHLVASYVADVPCKQVHSFLAHPLSCVPYRGTSLIRNAPLLGPYRRTIPRVLW